MSLYNWTIDVCIFNLGSIIAIFDSSLLIKGRFLAWMSKETRAFQHYFKCLCFCQPFLFFHVINSLGGTVGFKLMELLRIWLNPTAPLGERIKGQILIFFCASRSHQSPCFPPHSTCSPGPLLSFQGLDWLSQAFNWWAVGPLCVIVIC